MENPSAASATLAVYIIALLYQLIEREDTSFSYVMHSSGS